MEIWKDIKDYEGLYQVSNLGNVKSFKQAKEKILKQNFRNQYLCVRLYKNKKGTTKTTHKIVAQAFLNHIPDGYKLVIDHINFIKTDNRSDNLRIVTARENTSKRQIKSSSKYTGVHWCKQAKKWQSKIRINGKKKHLGSYKNELDAHNAYQKELNTIQKD